MKTWIFCFLHLDSRVNQVEQAIVYQAAFFGFPRMASFPGCALAMSGTRRLTGARFSGPPPVRFRCASAFVAGAPSEASSRRPSAFRPPLETAWAPSSNRGGRIPSRFPSPHPSPPARLISGSGPGATFPLFAIRFGAPLFLQKAHEGHSWSDAHTTFARTESHCRGAQAIGHPPSRSEIVPGNLGRARRLTSSADSNLHRIGASENSFGGRIRTPGIDHLPPNYTCTNVAGISRFGQLESIFALCPIFPRRMQMTKKLDRTPRRCFSPDSKIPKQSCGIDVFPFCLRCG